MLTYLNALAHVFHDYKLLHLIVAVFTSAYNTLDRLYAVLSDNIYSNSCGWIQMYPPKYEVYTIT